MSLALFDLDEGEMVMGAAVTGAVLNPQGHIGFVHDGDERPVYGVDTGNGVLHMWLGQSVDFTPDAARSFAEALIAWADLRGGDAA